MQCHNCGSAMRWVPPGTSKRTGQPYNGFWACENRDCGNKVTGQPPQAAPTLAPTQVPQPSFQPRPAQPRTVGKPLDERASIERQAAIKAAAEIAATGRIKPNEVTALAAEFVGFILTGNVAQEEPEIQVGLDEGPVPEDYQA